MNSDNDGPAVLSDNLFPVVGIGASAGGLDAFKRLLKTISADSGMAFVLIQHLDPSHESLLPELLQKVTKVPVLEITDDIKVRPDHIYIIPSNKILLASDGVLQLNPRPSKSKTKRYLPIDLFFTSLAEVHRSHAIGVVLSGTGSDGTQGLAAIKDYEGTTFAQEVESAAYGGMPRSAIEADVVDYVLAAEEMLPKLLEIKQKIHFSDVEADDVHKSEEEIYKQITALLRVRKNADFTYYKQTTIRRRIMRRMKLHKQESPVAYLKYLRANKPEQDALFQDILIPVTTFFRDQKIFESLCISVFPLLLKSKPTGAPLRVWVAGCSTGQEAYSIAICLKEFLGDHPDKAQVFATDISEPAIAKARSGMYTSSEVADISADRLQTYFTKVDGQYQINKEIRDLCVFAVHNFLKDPPFGKIDFVSCRNVLIYMEPYLQKKALSTFHYALNPKGFLLLGKSETGSTVPSLFVSANKQDKLFSRKDVPGRFQLLPGQPNAPTSTAMNTLPKIEHVETDFQKTADNIILSKYSPPGVVINAAMDIVHFRGSTSNYLEQAPGKPSHNLLKMAKSGLAFELRNILHKAAKEQTAVSKENIPIQVQGLKQLVTIEAIPLPNVVEPHYLILFHPYVPVLPAKTTSPAGKDGKDLHIDQLEKELIQSREDMRSITQDQEAANEELQSANEELLSSSEELQSLNEELETGKEELQSTNEELLVANQELITLNEQVTAGLNYAESIVGTIRQPLLVLDKNLRIKTANLAFYETFQVDEKHTEGALIYDLGDRQWNIPLLRTLLEEILPQKNAFKDYEVTHTFPGIGERVMRLSGRKMTGEKEAEKLILLAIEDVTERVAAQNKKLEDQQLREKDLEDRVQQRTTELSSANDKLVKINIELESFNYVSSHDLQEPLRKIQTYAKLILEREQNVLSDKGKDYFRRMQDAAMRMQDLINDLLAFSKINTADRKFETTDLQLIVAEVILDFKETIEEKKAKITVGALGAIDIIPFQFRQLLHNLIGNALKFSSAARAPRIIITGTMMPESELMTLDAGITSQLIPGKKYFHFCIADNGIGFAPEYKDRIFDLFQRLHGKDEYPGTGIGLAIVKKIVANHNGVTIATSALDRGARFDIYLPVRA